MSSGQCVAFRPAGSDFSRSDRRTWREVTAGPAFGERGTGRRNGGDRVRRVPGTPGAAAAASVGLPSEGRGEAAAPVAACPLATLAAYCRSPRPLCSLPLVVCAGSHARVQAVMPGAPKVRP